MADRDGGFGKAAPNSKIQELSEVVKEAGPPSVAVNPGGGAVDDSLLDLVH